jgi:hypothetical protein
MNDEEREAVEVAKRQFVAWKATLPPSQQNGFCAHGIDLDANPPHVIVYVHAYMETALYPPAFAGVAVKYQPLGNTSDPW